MAKTDDITFCSNIKCGYLRCHRNPKNILRPEMPHSFAMLDGTDMCYKIINNTNKRKIKQQDFN